MFSGLAGLRSLQTSISRTARSETCFSIFWNRLATCSRSSSVTGRLRPLTSIRMGLLSYAPAMAWCADVIGHSQRPHVGDGPHPLRAVVLERAGADVERRSGGVDVVDEHRDPRRRPARDRGEAARGTAQRAPRADLPPTPVGAPEARGERQPGAR